MATVQFKKGYSWENPPNAQVVRVLPVDRLLCKLAEFRADWQEIAESEETTLAEIRVGVGFILADICALLELTPAEILQVLGSELAEAVR